VIGATNHVKLLDRALFRRFDAVLEYALPSEEIASQVMRARLALLDTSEVSWSDAAAAAETLSHAEITHACEQAPKNAILEHTTKVRNDELVAALKDRRSTHPQPPRRLTRGIPSEPTPHHCSWRADRREVHPTQSQDRGEEAACTGESPSAWRSVEAVDGTRGGGSCRPSRRGRRCRHHRAR